MEQSTIDPALAAEFDFDQYGRSAFVHNIIEANRSLSDRFTVLDVGGRGNQTKLFLPQDTVHYLDPYVETTDDNHITGDGCDLPFPDNAYDWVVTLDTLEHIPADQREQFLSEQLRVARYGVIIAGPFHSSEVVQAEKNVNDFYKELTGEDHPWLKEHHDYGLPAETIVTTAAQQAGYTVERYTNNTLSLWGLLLQLNILFYQQYTVETVRTAMRRCNGQYNTELFAMDTEEPSYRKIFLIKKQAINGIQCHKQLIPPSVKEKILQQFFLCAAVLCKVYDEKEKLLPIQQQTILELQQAFSQAVHARNIGAQRNQEQQHALQEYKNTLLQQTIALEATATSLQTTNHSLQTTRDQLLETTATLETTTAQLITAEGELHLMRSSKFWKLRTWYLKVRQIRPETVLLLSKKALWILRQKGVRTTLRYAALYLRHGRSYFQQHQANADDYQLWQQQHEHYQIKAMQTMIAEWTNLPLISIIVPVYNIDIDWLNQCIHSVFNQSYPNWELCIHDDGSTDPRIVSCLQDWAKKDARIKISYGSTNENISGASNRALALATGDYVALLDADDTLAPWALFEVVSSLQRHPTATILYSDEDKLNQAGIRVNPFFKPDWSPDLLLSMMYTSHLTVYERSLITQLDGFRLGYEGAQDYDLMLRATEQVDEQTIIHIPSILYHWREAAGSTAVGVSNKPAAHQHGKQALQDALQRRHIAATVIDGYGPGRYRVHYRLNTKTLISIIIPFKDHPELLRVCLDSIKKTTTSVPYEIILIDNQTTDVEMLAYKAELQASGTYTVLDYPYPFNYPAINNLAVEHAHGEYLLLLNNDIEAITDGWLDSMVEHIQRPEVGAVGALLLYPNTTVQHAGVVLGIGGIAGHAFKYAPVDTPGYMGQLHIVRDCSAVTGACLLTRTALYRELGGLDAEHLTVAFNDVDYCLRVRAAGYRIIYTPYARLYHHESITRGVDEGADETKRQRLAKEQAYMLHTWQTQLLNDPYYNKNLTLRSEDYRLRIDKT